MEPHSTDSTSLFVRVAERTDLAGLLRLYRDLNPDDAELSVHEAEPHFDALGRIPGSAVHVGVLNETIVSSCTLIVVPNITRGGQPYALIENVVTASQHRGRGYGRATLQHAISAAWDHSCYKVMLLTGSTKPGTLGFYRSAGFEQNKTGFQIRRIAPRVG